MTEHDYEATVETEHGTFSFSGDEPRVVSAQVARMPVKMHEKQLQNRIDLDIPITEYLLNIAEKENAKKQKNRRRLRNRNR